MLKWISNLERSLRHLEQNAKSERALAICFEARELLMPIEKWWQDTGCRLIQQPIHGDYGGDNLLFDDDRVVALLDFDFLAIRERAFEIAYCLYWMLLRLEGRKPAECYSWNRVGQMLGCYNSTSSRPLTSDEIRSIPIEMARVPLYWIAEANFTEDPFRSLLGQAESIAFSRWMLEHGEEVSNRMNDI